MSKPTSKRTIYCQHDPLGDRLLREALESRPAFSEALHERIAATIGKCQDQDATPSLEPQPHLVSGDHSAAIWHDERQDLSTVRRGQPREWVLKGSAQRVAAMVAAACVLLAIVATAGRFAWHPLPNLASSRDLANHSHAVEAGDSAASVARLATPPRLPQPVVSTSQTDWRLLASLSPARNTREPSPNQLVYDDARRAARVLFDRLPVDLRLTDLTLLDE